MCSEDARAFLEKKKTLLDYVRQLRSNDNAYHCLLEFTGDIAECLIAIFKEESDSTTKAQIIEILWRRQQDSHILSFLCGALRYEDPVIWKAALDGIVSVGGAKSLSILKDSLREDGLGEIKKQWIAEAIDQIELN